MVSQAQNLRWGPVNMSLGVSVGATYEDNANLSENNPKGDVTLDMGPTLNGAITLPFAGGEQFTLGMSATYSKSLTRAKPDSFGAPLTAALTLPIYLGKWSVVLSDTFGFTNDPLESTFAASRNQVKQYSNSALASATRQFGKFGLTLAAQRSDKWVPDFPQQEEIDYQVSVTPAIFLREGFSVFLRNTLGWVLPADKLTRSDTTGWSSELGISGQITPSLSGSISAGFSHSHVEAYGTNTAQNIDGISSSLGLSYTHPLRPNTTHSISFSRSPGVTAMLNNSNIQEAHGVTYGIAHRLNRYITLTPTVGWTHFEDVGRGGAGEKADIVSVGIGLSRQITRKLSGSMSYQFQTRSSNIANGSYDVNRVQMSLHYTF
jgi:hypothetical protein